MKILLTGIEHPEKIGAWSGIPYFLSRALSRRFDLCYNGGMSDWRYAPFHLAGRICEKIAPGRCRIRAEPDLLRVFASRLQTCIRREKPDVVLSISAEPVAYLKPGPPVYIIHDATFRLLENYYASFSRLNPRSRRTGEEAMLRGFARCTGALSASEWALRSACTDYGVAVERGHVFPMGANLADPPGLDEAEANMENRLNVAEKHFLFAGVDWKRKGGDTAVRVVGGIVARGIRAKLHIVGCDPPESARAHPFLMAHGFLSKGNPEHAARLRELYEKANFFIVPSEAEAYGCVFCEANAFGVPVLARDTGGIGEIVRPGVNGFLLSPTFGEKEMIEEVVKLCAEPNAYRNLARSSRREYETRLNWDTYATRLDKLLNS